MNETCLEVITIDVKRIKIHEDYREEYYEYGYENVLKRGIKMGM